MSTSDRPLVVSLVVTDGMVGSFGIGVAAEVFGYDRREMGLPRFDFALVSRRPGVLRTDTGLAMLIEHGLDRLAVSDIVLITAWEQHDRPPPAELLEGIRAAHARGALIVSHCTGAFALAWAGLLDGQRATTHWKYAGELAARFPRVHVDPAVLYVDNGQVITGAGTASGIDALLHLVRREWGAAAANALAREMVVPPHRDGGQAQYIDTPVARCEDDLLGVVLEWARAHLAEEISVELLARRALMSPRSFARRFKATTGTTPHAWLLAQRLAAAEALLEDSDAPVEEIARLVGFGTAAGLREQFTRRRGVSPRAYRQTFRAGARPGSSAGTAPVQLHRDRLGAGGVRGDEPGVQAGLGQPA
ncbi:MULTISPECIES: helix-turn-helix domain-containing protein [unclassified Modestobacter]|uniref:helix-turn-helix domain-containing protein n=1 Tax=unclassified Modestobacter TaxID=2643866 RepID=UPI0022AA9570|nr:MULTISPECIES: helix-turn-helix domain-containing protein [unclassified Modestobacter]MCZ2823532.1 helix-turn-helix domain-containing protein [Modestobacter sp. VKM Ac-2981]MCZ2851777.1 helix-turn-helix domain-containing protein [Modestobacter sp. VKM Ac-2982]